MEKNLLNEISQMKFLFGYKAGRVMSEQEIAEPEIDIDVTPDTGKPSTRPNPFNPDRAREFDPFPDLEPQGKEEYDIEMNEPGVAEPEIDIDITPDTGKPSTRPNPFNPDRAREFDPFPDLEPQGRMEDEEARDLDTLVMKYLNSRNN